MGRVLVGALACRVQAATNEQVELTHIEQGYTGAQPAKQASLHSIRLEVVKLDQAKRSFALPPRRPSLARLRLPMLRNLFQNREKLRQPRGLGTGV